MNGNKVEFEAGTKREVAFTVLDLNLLFFKYVCYVISNIFINISITSCSSLKNKIKLKVSLKVFLNSFSTQRVSLLASTSII